MITKILLISITSFNCFAAGSDDDVDDFARSECSNSSKSIGSDQGFTPKPTKHSRSKSLYFYDDVVNGICDGLNLRRQALGVSDVEKFESNVLRIELELAKHRKKGILPRTEEVLNLEAQLQEYQRSLDLLNAEWALREADAKERNSNDLVMEDFENK